MTIDELLDKIYDLIDEGKNAHLPIISKGGNYKVADLALSEDGRQVNVTLVRNK